MANIKYVNEQLKSYLDKKGFGDYSKLIDYVLKDETPIHAKYNLLCLLMNHGSGKIALENMVRQFRELHCLNPDINEFLKERVFYNPKFGTITIESRYSKNSISVSVPHHKDIDKQFKAADEEMERLREVLTMIIIESRSVSIEEDNSEKSET